MGRSKKKKKSSDSSDVILDSIDVDADQSQPLLLGEGSDITDVQKVKSQRKIHIFNVIVASVTFMLQLIVAPFHFNDIHRIWNTSQYSLPIIITDYTLYGCAIISCLVAPTFIRIFGPKFAFIFGYVCIAAYTTSSFSPILYFYIAGAVFAGFAFGLVFTTLGSFVTAASVQYATSVDQQNTEGFISVFNGLSFMFLLSAPVWRYILQIAMMRDEWTEIWIKPPCGAEHCPDIRDIHNMTYHIPKLGREMFRIEAMLGTYLTISLIGILVLCVCLTTTNKRHIGMKEFITNKSAMCFATFYLWKDSNVKWLCPIFLFIGMQQNFLYTVYMEAVVECSLNTKMLAYMVITAATASFIAAPATGMLIKYVGRVKLFLFAFALNLSFHLTILLWKPDIAQIAVFLVLAAMGGCADGILQVQISAFIGFLYKTSKEAAFSNYRVWQILGILIMITLKRYTCTHVCIYCALGLLVFASTTYVATEIRVKLQEQERKAAVEQNYVMPDSTTWLPSLNPHDISRQRASLSDRTPSAFESDDDFED